MAGSKPGERRGGRQKGTPNKATVAKRRAQAASLAEARASVLSGVDLSDLDGITGLQVMRLAMAAHLKEGRLDAAAAWGEKMAPYETPKPGRLPDKPPDSELTIMIRGGLPSDDPHRPADVSSAPGGDLPEPGKV